MWVGDGLVVGFFLIGFVGEVIVSLLVDELFYLRENEGDSSTDNELDDVLLPLVVHRERSNP